MSRLFRYLAREYAIMCLVAYLSLLIFFSIFELAEFARIAAIAHREFSLALDLTAWNLAVITGEVGPLSALVAAVLVGTSMSRKGEVTAVLSAGISPLRLYLPIAIVAAGFALSLFFVMDRVTPRAVQRIDQIMMNELSRKSYAATYFSMRRQWFKVGDSFVRVGEVDAPARAYYGVDVLELELGRVRRKIHADRVLARESELIGQSVTIESYPRTTDPQPDVIAFEKRDELQLPLQKGFNAFLDLSSRPQKMQLDELERVYKLRRRQGYDPRLYYNEFYSRVMFPIVILMLTIVGSVFAFVPSTKRSFVMAILELLVITLVAFVARQAFRSFANSGFVSAQMGAIGPALVLAAIAVWRLRRLLLPLTSSRS